MLDMRTIRDCLEEVRHNTANRHIKVDFEQLLAIDDQARQVKTELDAIRQQQNENASRIRTAQDASQRQELIDLGSKLKLEQAKLAEKYRQLDEQRLSLQRNVPNLSHPDSPLGGDDGDNLELRVHDCRRQFSFAPKNHLELMENLDLIDMEGGRRVAGNKFYFFKNEAVRLELALISFGLDMIEKEGFSIISTPDVARDDILEGIGFNPRDESTQVYKLANTDLSLIATAEITLGGLWMGKTIAEEQLPIMYGGVSHCYRTEAGAAGRESMGLYRVHQFTKVEMFAYTTPEQSEAMHLKMLEVEEKIYQALEIPYRVVDVCSGDLGAPAWRKYDLEAWMPGRNNWGEITSTSNCTDYQTRRLNIRMKRKNKKGTELAHTLNGTAIAVPRTIIALLENGQQADGSVILPDALGMPPLKPKLR